MRFSATPLAYTRSRSARHSFLSPSRTASAKGFDPDFGRLRARVTGANLQPAVAWYLLASGEPAYLPLAFDVLRIEEGLVAEITSFVFPELFEAFDLPMSFPADARST